MPALGLTQGLSTSLASTKTTPSENVNAKATSKTLFQTHHSRAGGGAPTLIYRQKSILDMLGESLKLSGATIVL